LTFSNPGSIACVREEMSVNIVVEPVAGKKQLKEFVRLPYMLYRKDSHWVAQLMMDDMKKLDREKHPFFKHAAAELFVARQSGKAVGRIAVIDDSLWKEVYGEKAAYWGWLECVNEPDVAKALFETAYAWARNRGCTRIIGPMSPNANDIVGLLVKGFDEPPCIMMPYNPAYYGTLIEGCGNRKWKDLIAWLIDDDTIPERLAKIMPVVEKRGKFSVRTVNMKDFAHEIERARDIYNEFEKVNSIYTPFTEEEFEYTGKDLKIAIDPGLVLFAEVDGKPVGLSLAIPDMNVALKPARGRLFPFGIIKILLAQKRIKRIRVLSMGVLKDYRNRGIDISFYYHTYVNAKKKGYTSAELSWVEEDNTDMNNVASRLNAKPYKTYRVYEHAL
jgi:GNAT superfamily N-acetyltransferase